MKLKLFTLLVFLIAALQQGKTTCTSAPTNLVASQNGSQMLFSWSDVGASSYIIEIRDPSINYPWEDLYTTFRDTVSTASYSPDFGVQGYQLEWRIRAICAAGEQISTPVFFNTVCAVASSAQTQDIGFDTVRLVWNFNGIPTENYFWSLGYRVLGASSWISIPFSSTNYTPVYSTILRNLLPNTTYEWCVNQVCSYTNTIGDPVISQFTTPSSPICPNPSILPASNITSTSATLNWGTVPQASNYYVQWFINNAPLPSGTATVSGNSYLLSGLQPGNSVVYRVSAVCPFVSGYNFSTFASFVTLIPPPQGQTFFIDYFKVGGIERTSVAEAGNYINTGLSTPVIAGQTYQFKISMGSTGTYAKQNYAIYLDVNGNGTLENGERLFGVGAAFNANIINLNIKIPSTATNGLSRLRVIMKTANGGISPNITPEPGVEIEDYWLDVQTSASFVGQTGQSQLLKQHDLSFENPCAGYLNIRNLQNVSKIRVINEVGQLIFDKSYDGNEAQDLLDLTTARNGIYFVEFTDKVGARMVEKLIIQNQ